MQKPLALQLSKAQIFTLLDRLKPAEWNLDLHINLYQWVLGILGTPLCNMLFIFFSSIPTIHSTFLCI